MTALKFAHLNPKMRLFVYGISNGLIGDEENDAFIEAIKGSIEATEFDIEQKLEYVRNFKDLTKHSDIFTEMT